MLIYIAVPVRFAGEGGDGWAEEGKHDSWHTPLKFALKFVKAGSPDFE
jgi:hypothetical protein